MPPGFFACEVCGASIRERALSAGEELRCGRCLSTVRRAGRQHLLHVTWALASTGLILCLLANAYPILTFEVAGNAQSNSVLTGVAGLVAQGYWPIAALVLFCAALAPFLHFAAVWYVAAAWSLRRAWPHVPWVARAAGALEPWSLVPVFAVSCAVAVVKLDMLGHVTWDAGIGWILALAACSFAMARVLDLEVCGQRETITGRRP